MDLLLVDKPKGITSFDVIRRLRKELGIRKMGHAGTLDPLATGLLLIGVGEGTKQLSSLIGLPKTYEAEIKLGSATDSGDMTGAVTAEAPVPNLSKEEVEKVVLGMKGTHALEVSLFSAIKRGGKPLYEYAREGKEVEKPVRDMTVRDARLISFSESGDVVSAFFDVSSGTYIRSLAEELGRRLGTVAHIQNLRRTSIGEYKVSDARTV
jgi:tRNA pseudouridine55 synthase